MILDVLTEDPEFVDRSEAALRRAAGDGALVISECVLAEIRPVMEAGAIEEFLDDWGIEFVPSSRESALLAGRMLQQHLRRRESGRSRALPDFLIGAHAQLHAHRLLARDRGFFRDYFEALPLLLP